MVVEETILEEIFRSQISLFRCQLLLDFFFFFYVKRILLTSGNNSPKSNRRFFVIVIVNVIVQAVQYICMEGTCSKICPGSSFFMCSEQASKLHQLQLDPDYSTSELPLDRGFWQ